MKKEKTNLIEVVRERLARSRGDDFSGQSVLFLNPYSYMILRSHPHLLASAGRIALDGQLLVKILSLFWLRRIDRISFDMTSLAPVVFERAAALRQRVYIVGSTQQDLTRALEILSRQYPDLVLCGSRNGYFESEATRGAALEAVVKSDADILVCGMGSPHQERFLYDLREMGWSGTGYTCGGFLHQTATRGVRYYPAWVNRLNLRWAYRIYDEPKLIRRYFFGYPVAVFLIIKDCLNTARQE